MIIRAIGFGRLILIVVLFIIVAALFGYNQFFLQKKIDQTQRFSAGYSSDLSSMRQKTVRLQDGFKFFEREKVQYSRLNKIGFFNVQGRFDAGQRLKAILEGSNLLSSSKYALKPAETEQFTELSEAGYEMLSSEMELELHATKDSDIFNYLFFLKHGFPGVVTIDSMEITRSEEITQPILRRLGNDRDATALVKAKVNATWRSATKKVDGAPSGNQEEVF